MTKDISLAVIDGSALTERDVMVGIDNVLSELYQTSDLEHATQVITVIDKIGDVSGKAKAKLLHGMLRWWTETGQDEKRGDTFADHMESKTGNRAVTVSRYVNVWKYIDESVIPKEVAERPIRDLIPIATALSQGYDFTKEQWKKLEKAANFSDVSEIVRQVKGKAARKSSMQIVLTRDGSLSVWKENKRYSIGYLDLKSDSEVVQKAIQRIIDSANIQEE